MEMSMNETNMQNTKKPVWLYGFVFLLLAGAAYAGYSYTMSPSASPMPSVQTPSVTNKIVDPTKIEETQLKEHNVEITSAGYSPAVLSISVGDTVIWTYTGDKSSNVSSDPHPEHTDYPPLNLGMFKAGATQSLTFDHPGTYGYHNHFNASQVGTIIVK